MKRIILGSLVLGCLFAQEGVDSKIIKKGGKSATLEKPQVLERMQMDKTGLLVGVELAGSVGLGKSRMAEQSLPMTNTNPPTGLLSSLNALAFHTKLVVGFQEYFGRNQDLGFDIKGKVGAGYLNIRHEGQSIVQNGGFRPVGDSGFGLESAYVSYTVGLEANFLYDFWSKGEQSAGVSVGLGYDFVYGANAKLGFVNLPQGFLTSYFGTYADKNLSYHVIAPKVGLHYHLGRHQFAGVLSFDKPFGVSPNVNIVFDTAGKSARDSLVTDPSIFFALNLSYTYRF